MTLKARILDLKCRRPIIVVNEADAKRLGVIPGTQVKIFDSTRPVPATVYVSGTMIGQGYVGLSPEAAERLGVEDGDRVRVTPMPPPDSLPHLHRRLRGERLSELEIKSIITDIVEGSYDEAGIAAFLVSQLVYGLSEEELTALVKAMVETGETLAFEELVYDEHSIGGVPGNSKVALLAVPIVASTGLLIPKTSSRAITSPAGTADTMEVLAKVEFEPEELKEIARRVRGTLVWGGRLNLAPADDILVQVERKLHIDPYPQMVASILSKKVAMGVSRLVIDIPVGKGAKIESISAAERLAAMFITQGGRLSMNIKVAMTYGGQPIGHTIGPALEAREALETHIAGKGSLSLIEKATTIAGLVLEMAGKTPQGSGRDLAYQLLRSGKAYEKFREIIEAQGGDPEVKPEDISVGKYKFTMTSHTDGAVTHVDNAALTLIAKAAGAPEDKTAGIYLHAKTGYRVRKGDPLITIYSGSKGRLSEAMDLAAKYAPIVVESMLLKLIP